VILVQYICDDVILVQYKMCCQDLVCSISVCLVMIDVLPIFIGQYTAPNTRGLVLGPVPNVLPI